MSEIKEQTITVYTLNLGNDPRRVDGKDPKEEYKTKDTKHYTAKNRRDQFIKDNLEEISDKYDVINLMELRIFPSHYGHLDTVSKIAEYLRKKGFYVSVDLYDEMSTTSNYYLTASKFPIIKKESIYHNTTGKIMFKKDKKKSYGSNYDRRSMLYTILIDGKTEFTYSLSHIYYQFGAIPRAIEDLLKFCPKETVLFGDFNIYEEHLETVQNLTKKYGWKMALDKTITFNPFPYDIPFPLMKKLTQIGVDCKKWREVWKHTKNMKTGSHLDNVIYCNRKVTVKIDKYNKFTQEECVKNNVSNISDHDATITTVTL